jgi:cell division transport system permease protein
MKKYFYNIKYFLKETKTLIKLNKLSNVTTLLCIALILFILSMVISGWWISNKVADAISKEAEISVYYDDYLNNSEITGLVEKISKINGVDDVNIVDESEAYERMVNMLEYLDENPFSSFLEVRIHLDSMDYVLEELEFINGVNHVRDNRKVLNRLRSIGDIMKFLGYLIVIAVSITTLVIISHIIRLGVQSNKDQINTMRLLGAPEGFIAFPFFLEGLFLTISGGVLASALSLFVLKKLYAQMQGPLPFIPLPSLGVLSQCITILVMLLSAVLGIIGSLFGIKSAKDK